MQGNLEPLNSVSGEGGENTSAVMPARASSRHTLGELWWEPHTALPGVQGAVQVQAAASSTLQRGREWLSQHPEHDLFKPDTPVKTTSLLLMVEFSTITFETQLPSLPK